MNILEYIDDLMQEGYTEEQAYSFADEAFGLYEPDDEFDL